MPQLAQFPMTRTPARRGAWSTGGKHARPGTCPARCRSDDHLIAALPLGAIKRLSARCNTVSRLSLGWIITAPNDAVTCSTGATGRPAIAAHKRSATLCSPGASTSGTIARNSSPPQREMLMPARSTSRTTLDDRLQHLVARRVAVRIVDRLERVQTPHDHPGRGSFAQHPAQHLLAEQPIRTPYQGHDQPNLQDADEGRNDQIHQAMDGREPMDQGGASSREQGQHQHDHDRAADVAFVGVLCLHHGNSGNRRRVCPEPFSRWTPAGKPRAYLIGPERGHSSTMAGRIPACRPSARGFFMPPPEGI